MDKKTADALARLLDIMDRLRVECPWDRAQTIESLRKNTIEETFELADAIDEGDMEHIREELGDLLLHIVFYSKIGSEKGAFTLADVAEGISNKLVYRHPHVFGDVHASTPEQVKQNWEALKQKEGKKRKGVLAGVPKGLPAMVKAYRIGEKAASAGFDWEHKEDVWEKVREEAAEVEAEMRAGELEEGMRGGEMAGCEADAGNHERKTEEFGDLFFALVNAARLYGVDPEAALERTNKKFMARFAFIEQFADSQKRAFLSFSAAELDELWRDANKTVK